MIVWSVETKQNSRLDTVTLANMYSLIQDKLHRREYQHEHKTIPLKIIVKPFDHVTFHESFRNEFAKAASLAYTNDTKRKIWQEQSCLRHEYGMYNEGYRTKEQLQDYCYDASKRIKAWLQSDRTNVAD